MKEELKMEKVTIGLVKGRHEMPVSEYIFDQIEDVLDFDSMNEHIMNFLRERVGVKVNAGCGINQAYLGDVDVFKGERELVCYVTGLTAATASLVALCAANGIRLSLMHYDRDTDSYKEQRLF